MAIRFIRFPGVAAASRPARAQRLRAGAAVRAASGSATVSFRLPHHVEFGQEVCVIGEAESLGKWDPAAALPLTWTEGDVWTVEAEVPSGTTLQYKYLIRVPGSGEVLAWQAGDNLTVELTGGATCASVTDSWSGSHDVELSADAVEVTAAAAPAAEALGAATAALAAEAPAAKAPATAAPAGEAPATAAPKEVPPAAAPAVPAATKPSAPAAVKPKAADMRSDDSTKAAEAVAAAAEVLAAAAASMDDAGGNDTILEAAKAATAAGPVTASKTAAKAPPGGKAKASKGGKGFQR